MRDEGGGMRDEGKAEPPGTNSHREDKNTERN